MRAAILGYQRGFARHAAGAVLDGRDIGTVVCPDAEVKIYVTASPEVRAKRRHLELKGPVSLQRYEAVLADIRRRDERDAVREVSPMRPAADAPLAERRPVGGDPEERHEGRSRSADLRRQGRRPPALSSAAESSLASGVSPVRPDS